MSATALSPLLPRIPEPHVRGRLLPTRIVRLADALDLPWACQTLSARHSDATLDRAGDHVCLDLPAEPGPIGGLDAAPGLLILLTGEGVICLTLRLAIDHDLDELERLAPAAARDGSLLALYDDHLRALRDVLAPALTSRRRSVDLGWFSLISARVRPGTDFLRAYRSQIRGICGVRGQHTLRILDQDDAQIAIADGGAFVIARQGEALEREVLASAAHARALRDEQARLARAAFSTRRSDSCAPRSAIREALDVPRLDREVRRLRELAADRHAQRRARVARIRIELLLWVLVALSVLLLLRGSI